MASEGYTQSDIAATLQVSQGQISKDISAITRQAQQDINHHIQKNLPYERKKALALFESIKNRAVQISNKEPLGERDRIAALSLVKDVQKEIWHLQTQGDYVKRAVHIVDVIQSKLDEINNNNNNNNNDDDYYRQEEEEQEEEEEEEQQQIYNDQ